MTVNLRVTKLITMTWLLLAVPTVAAEPGEAPADSLAGGTGTSYWGEIPPPDQGNTAEKHDNRRPLWESVLYYPYQIIAVPLWLVGQGIGEVTAWATESTTAHRIGQIITLSFLPFESSMGVTAGGEDGLGVSFSGDRRGIFGPRDRMRLALRYTTKYNSKATLGMVFNDGGINSTSLGIGYRLKPDTRFYGIGPNTLESALGYYTTETTWAAGGYRRDLGRGAFLELMGMYTSVATRGPRQGQAPSLEDRIPEPDDRPFGYGERSEGVALTLALGRNGTRVTGRPQHGRLVRAFASWFSATDATDVEFLSYRAEIQQFLPLWHTRRGLALRGYFTRILNHGSDPVPFQRLMFNNEPDLLRGYKDWRFRDSGLTGATVEYRFPVWNFSDMDDVGLDTYLFADWGQVFDDTREIALENLTTSLGVGWRAITTQNFMIRLEIGFSEEETVIRLAGEQTFQFKKGGVLHGRSPVPVR